MNCYDDCQFAYRKNSSTVCALITAHDCILRFLDDPLICAARVLTFDMSHAFDSVPHDRLVNRIIDENECLGVWLSNYLSSRQQRVRLGQTTSSLCNVTSGVPQGSILGPYLFSIFMSTYSTLNSLTKLIKYADDVTIVIPIFKSNTDDLSIVSSEIENFSRWCTENCMSIDTDKTKVMSVTLKVNITDIPFVPNLSNVTSLKLLGLVFNNTLTWKNHFDYMISKLSRRLYVLRVLRSSLSHDEMVTVFNAIFRSITDYACQVF